MKQQTSELPFEISHNLPAAFMNFKSSFLGILHEQSNWDEKKYWDLDKSLHDLFVKYNGKELPRSIVGPVTKVFSHIIFLISCSHDDTDSFKIKNIQAKDLNNFRERVRLMFEGFLLDEIPKNNFFAKVNPLY
jgi:hypothetical protein